MSEPGGAFPAGKTPDGTSSAGKTPDGTFPVGKTPYGTFPSGKTPYDQPTGGWDVLVQASELARSGQPFALATVVWRQGPSSSQQGSRAIITAAGELHGWIGGACAEPTVIREAREVIVEGKPRLLLLGEPGQFGATVPDGMTVVPISCQSEGALEVYIEPIVPAPHLVIVGRSPMTQTLAGMAGSLGWHTSVVAGEDFAAADAGERSMVVVATQGHGDEEVIEQAVAARPAYLGLVGSRRRGAAILGYLAERGVPEQELNRVRVPAGLDLGRITHQEIAVAILAELVQLRACGTLAVGSPVAVAVSPPVQAVDPVCGMTVAAGPAGYPAVHDGATYHFCSTRCRREFGKDPAAYTKKESRCLSRTSST